MGGEAEVGGDNGEYAFFGEQGEKAGEIPEDQAKRAGERLQRITDANVGRIESIASRKESEVMEV